MPTQLSTSDQLQDFLTRLGQACSYPAQLYLFGGSALLMMGGQRRAATAAVTLEEKLAGQKQVKALEAQRNTRRRALFDAQDEIDRRRGELIADLEGKMKQVESLTPLFALRWRLT